MFHGDVAHTGYSSGSGPSTNQTLWVFKTNGKIWSSPAVANGIVYIASFDRNVYAINAATGTKI
jgi:outer membrane protein assembly factor BamB